MLYILFLFFYNVFDFFFLIRIGILLFDDIIFFEIMFLKNVKKKCFLASPEKKNNHEIPSRPDHNPHHHRICNNINCRRLNLTM
jgi:hypothetical protein